MQVDVPLRYPTIQGYRIGEEIGGGGFSKQVLTPYPPSLKPILTSDHPTQGHFHTRPPITNAQSFSRD